MLRCECKFSNVRMHELIDYYKAVDKRMAWEGSTLYDSIEEVRAYPMNTSLYYFKLQPNSWPSGCQDLLLVTQGVEIRGNRFYLSSTSVEHNDFVSQKVSHRANYRVMSNYFEATTDN